MTEQSSASLAKLVTSPVNDALNDLPNIDGRVLSTPSLELLQPATGLDHPPRILLLYGSLRQRSFSRLLTCEAARVFTIPKQSSVSIT